MNTCLSIWLFLFVGLLEHDVGFVMARFLAWYTLLHAFLAFIGVVGWVVCVVVGLAWCKASIASALRRCPASWEGERCFLAAGGSFGFVDAVDSLLVCNQCALGKSLVKVYAYGAHC
jgi:hypothetical protein